MDPLDGTTLTAQVSQEQDSRVRALDASMHGSADLSVAVMYIQLLCLAHLPTHVLTACVPIP